MTERFSRDSMRLGGILTAMVTPFDAEGRLDEAATARLIHHLLENGSDGLVLAGSTGEGATMTDEEKVRLWELGVAESGDAPIIAGTGTYDTRHSVELTERAHEVGVDAMLVVTPYYVRPNRRGIRAHYEAVAAATDRPIVAYNIPSRTATDMPNDLLAELAQIENVAAVKQARYEDMAPIEGMDLLAGQRRRARQRHGHGRHGRDPRSRRTWSAPRCAAIIDEPERRHEIEDGLRDLYKAMFVTTNPIPLKAALNMLGHEVGAAAAAARGGLGGGARGHPRGARAPQPARRGLTNGTLRVLPLGGLGEIGKNMMVVEYGGRIIVVDTGLMFPAPDQLGIDLVLPDFTYLRERADDIEAIVLTHGHEDHVGALPFVLRELDTVPPVYGGPLTAAMVRSKLDEHKLKDVEVQDVLATQTFEAGPFSVEMVKMAHSIPDAFAVAITTELGTMLMTGDYKFDQTPVDGVPADVSRLAELGRERPAAPVRRLDQRRPSRRVAVRVERRPASGGGLRPLPRPDHRHLLRLEHPPRAAGGRCRGNGRPARLADRPLDAQEHEHRADARPHRHPRGPARRPEGDRGLPGQQARDHLHGVAGRAAARRCAAWPTATTRTSTSTTATP